jgi:hypothetical protein
LPEFVATSLATPRKALEAAYRMFQVVGVPCLASPDWIYQVLMGSAGNLQQRRPSDLEFLESQLLMKVDLWVSQLWISGFQDQDFEKQDFEKYPIKLRFALVEAEAKTLAYLLREAVQYV